MNAVQEIVDVMARLNEEARSLVLDFARLLRDRDGLMIPAAAALDGPSFERWKSAVQKRAVEVLLEQRRRLEAAGLPLDGPLPEALWPGDMAPASETSVET